MASDDDTVPPPHIARLKLRAAAGTVASRRDARHDTIVFVVTGKVTFRHFAIGLDQALDLGASERMLWNIVGADLTSVTLGELRAFVSHIFAGPWAPRLCAIRAEPGPSFAAASLMATAAEDLGLGDRVAVFERREAAFAWLGVQTSETTPAPPDPGLPGQKRG